ncbi:MAG: hypothetical protein ACI88G_001408 [Woeseiaceae bacterium]|jgi:hypothetical protein
MSDFRHTRVCRFASLSGIMLWQIFCAESRSVKKFERVLYFEYSWPLTSTSKASCDAPHGEFVST